MGTQEHTKTDESCTKAVGSFSIPRLLKRTGKKSTRINGPSGLNPNCPSGSVNDQAKRLENQNLLKMMKKEVLKPQQKKKKRKKRRKKRKRKKRKKKRNKSFIMHTASSS